jgi:transcriptional regulator with XRE-family HTH domain
MTIRSGIRKLFATRTPLTIRKTGTRAQHSQQEVADKAGLSTAGIADLEQGRREPSWATAVALTFARGVEVTAFLQTPAPRAATGRGRPRKAPTEQAEEPAPKRPWGRPRNQW